MTSVFFENVIRISFKMEISVGLTWFCSFVCLLHVYQASSVSISPKQVNATCPGQTITLICKNGTADGMVWQINGKDVAVYFPGPQENPCQDTNPFPNGDVGRYCGWTSNDETSSNLTFTAKPEQDKWNVTCLGSDSTFNDTTMIMVAKRSPMAVMNITLNCPDRVLSWQTSSEDYVDNFTIQIGNTTYSTLNQSFKLHQLDVESTKQLQFSVWASNCQGNGPNLSECFCQCESCIHNSSCDQPNQYTKNVSIVWSTLSLLSLIICCVAMLKHLNVRRCSDLMLSSNWETTFIACLIVSEMLLLVVNFLQMFVYLTESNSSRWCYVFGFFYQFALDTIALLTFAIDIYLFMFARNKGVVKPIQFGFACALLMGLSYPLSIVPFVEDCYGDSGGWCWISIKAKHDCSCKVENLAFYQQIGIWYAKIFAALIAGIILLSPHIFKRVVGRSHGEKFTAVFGLYFISFFAANLSGVLNRSLTWYYGNPTKFFQILQVLAFTLWPAISVLPILLRSNLQQSENIHTET